VSTLDALFGRVFAKGVSHELRGGINYGRGLRVTPNTSDDRNDVTEPARLRTLFVGKHGVDANDGLSPAEAKLTISAALTAADALTPSSSAPVAVVVVDAGTYDEGGLNVNAHVYLDARHAKLTAPAGTVLTVASGAIVRVREIAGDTDQDCLLKTNTAGVVLAHVGFLSTSGTGNAVEVSGGEVKLEVDELDAGVAWVVDSGATLRVRAGSVSGTETVNGLAYVSVAGRIWPIVDTGWIDVPNDGAGTAYTAVLSSLDVGLSADESVRLGANCYYKTDGDNTLTERSDSIELLAQYDGSDYQIVDADDDTVTADDTDYDKATTSAGNWRVQLTSAGALSFSFQRDASTDRQARVIVYRTEQLVVPTS